MALNCESATPTTSSAASARSLCSDSDFMDRGMPVDLGSYRTHISTSPPRCSPRGMPTSTEAQSSDGLCSGCPSANLFTSDVFGQQQRDVDTRDVNTAADDAEVRAASAAASA